MALLLLFLLFCFLGSVTSYDILFYATTWGPGFCTDYQLPVECRKPVRTDIFTIHGIWPVNNDGTLPMKCGGEKFTYEKVQSIAPDLDKYWPAPQNGYPNVDLWQHEWDVHGKCTGWTIADYFRVGLKLAREVDVLVVLQMNDITPGAVYDIGHIEYAFKGIVVPRCGKHKFTNSLQLKEFWFCLDGNQDFRSCTAEERTFGNCPGRVLFPDASVVT